MSGSPDDDKFEYDGRLVFNGLYIESDDNETPYDSKQELLGELSSFEEGVPGSSGSGFQDLNLSEWAERYSELSGEFETLLDQVWDFQFKNEEYDLQEEIIDSEGNEIEGWVRDHWSGYVYWYPGEFLLVQASKSKLDTVEDHLFPVIGRTNFRSFESIDDDSNSDSGGSEDGNGGDTLQESEGPFDPEFLQWLVWQYDTPGHPARIRLRGFSDAVMTGELSYFGETNEVSESEDITNSHPIIAGMLENRDFEKLEGVFEVDGRKVDAQIYSDGDIRVMAQEDIGDAPQFIRVLLANHFLREMMELYTDWQSRDPPYKYTHPRYFAELHENAKQMPNSAEYDFEFDELVSHYAELRDENPRSYSFDFDV